MVNQSTAETQARAKMSWGDSRDEVIKYLMLQGFSVAEAKETVRVLYRERLAALRSRAIGKIVMGIGAMCVPVIAYLLFAYAGVIFFKLMAVAAMVGLWGAWQALNGIITLVAPRMESGDVAD